MLTVLLACAPADSGTNGVVDSGTSADALACEGELWWGATVLDAERRVETAAVCLEGGTAAWVADTAGLGAPAGAVDLAGRFVVPGLVDSHVHLAHSGATVLVGDTLDFNVRASLYYGVTTVVDVGGPVSLYDLRDRLAGPSPRVVTSGPFLTVPGSHPCESLPDPNLCVFADEPGEEARALADQGADVLKVALADAAFTPWGATPRLGLAELDAIVAASLPVVAHVDTDQDAIDALSHGVAILGHPPFATLVGGQATAAATEARAVHTTVSAFAGVVGIVDGTTDVDAVELPPVVAENWRYVQAHPEVLLEGWAAESATWAQNARANLAALHAAGATVLPGSDAGYYFVPHGAGLHAELAAMAEMGFSPDELLRAATLEAREALSLPGGRVAAGEPADLLVLGSDPWLAVEAWLDIQRVAVRGGSWAREDLVPGMASDDILLPGDSGACLAHEDCTSGACDGLAHACAQACDAPYDVVNDCGASAWCLSADAAGDPQGVCRTETPCDLYVQDCAPAEYGMACLPFDEDTNACWYGGAGGAGDRCDASTDATACAPGMYCSPVDARCYALCDPELPACTAGRCHTVTRADGSAWFGICYE